MSSQAGPSSSRRVPAASTSSGSRQNRSGGNPVQRVPRAPSFPVSDDAIDIASPPPVFPRRRTDGYIPAAVLQEQLPGRQILANYRLESTFQDPVRADFTKIKKSMDYLASSGDGLLRTIGELLENPVTMDSLRPPPNFPELPPPALPPLPDLPPLIPNSEGPQLGSDADEEAEAAVSNFLDRQRARITGRRQIRDTHNALCARIQAEHYEAVDAEWGDSFAAWEAERIALESDVARYQDELEWRQARLAEVREEFDEQTIAIGRQLKRDHEIRALTRHAFRLRDEGSYIRESAVALQGNVSFGEDIDLFFKAALLGDVPAGYAYVPIDPATAPFLPPAPPPPNRKGKGVDPLERLNPTGRIIVRKVSTESSDAKGKGKPKSGSSSGNLESAKRPKVNLVLPAPPPEFAAPVASGSKKRSAVMQGTSERPSKQSKSDEAAPFSYKGRRTCNPHALSWKAWFTARLPIGRHLLRYGPHPMVKHPKPCVACNEKGWPCVADGDPEGKSASCASCVRAKTTCVPVKGGKDHGITEFLAYQTSYAANFNRKRGHLRSAFAAPFDFDTWYPPDIDYRNTAERRSKVPFKWTAEAAERGGAADASSPSKLKTKGAKAKESEEEDDSEDGNETEVDDAAPPIAVLPGSSEVPAVDSAPSAPVAAPSPAPPRRTQFHYRPSDLLGGDVENPLPRAKYNDRHHLPRDDFDMPVPPDSCFGKMRAWNIPQENYSPEITAARYQARQSWAMAWFMEVSRMILYSAGPAFTTALMRDPSPLDDLKPEETDRPLIVDGIPFPLPVPTLDSDGAWRTAALLKARAYPQSLRFSRALIDADTEGRILRGEGRCVNEHLPSGWDITDLFGFFTKDEAVIKQELEEREGNSLFLPGQPLRSTPFDTETSPPPLGPRPPSPPFDSVEEDNDRGANHRLAVSAGISPEMMRESIRAAAPRAGDSRAEASPRLPIFGQPSSALGGMRPFTFVPPLPPPLPSQPVRQPLADEIPIESDGRATSLAAEFRASSLVDRVGSRTPTRRSPASVKEEEGDPGRTTPFTDRRTWDVDGESLEDMDLTDNAAPS
ncbi:hypothetical protein B0H16DRAFT_1462230 [Mycena metata]|uniref:Uncharacterized protein n=1 Tax=Mycena metata TaxID=1033252 RepID=A0AAD7INU1_9AGAR|nr:hypothetical protein B0H16DRAFT_1462230 [Mycena metata]